MSRMRQCPLSDIASEGTGGATAFAGEIQPLDSEGACGGCGLREVAGEPHKMKEPRQPAGAAEAPPQEQNTPSINRGRRTIMMRWSG